MADYAESVTPELVAAVNKVLCEESPEKLVAVLE